MNINDYQRHLKHRISQAKVSKNKVANETHVAIPQISKI